MITFKLDTELGILFLSPNGALEAADFSRLTQTVDPWIEKAGKLNAVVIEVTEFPGWDSLSAMASHFRFVRDHHKHIEKLAIVTDGKIGDVAEKFASHFLAAEIRHFSIAERDTAKQWAMQ
jgi:hypothetical protein